MVRQAHVTQSGQTSAQSESLNARRDARELASSGAWVT